MTQAETLKRLALAFEDAHRYEDCTIRLTSELAASIAISLREIADSISKPRGVQEIQRAIEAMETQMHLHDLRTPDWAMAAVVRDALRWVLQDPAEAFSAALKEYEAMRAKCLN